MAVSQAELAEKGALIHLQDLKSQIEELYKAYPGLLKAEQNAKRNATMLAKYGTLNPHKVAEASAAKTTGPKKSHKKGAGKKAQAAAAQGQTVPGTEATASDVQTPPASEPEAASETVLEMTDQPETAQG
jgi:hypothetical protein